MKFDLPKDQSSIIKVIGVGGGGSNAVNHMFRQGIKGVDFIVCNTDHQALDVSPVPVKIQLGASLTEGRGAGSIPEVGMNAAIENLEEIEDILSKSTKMVFVTAGMGGGTGTGAAPVIAELARKMGILTVGIVTIPFMFEGRKRRQQAEAGIERMRDAVDTLLIINNDKLREIFGNQTLAEAFGKADDVLATAARGIAEVISVTGQINVDFNDVSTVMKDSGVAIMGSASAEGENRALKAVTSALDSPLLNDNNIEGAKYVLLNITYGEQEVLMDEIMQITDYIQDAAGSTADVIWGHAKDDSLGDKLSVTIIATGFKTSIDTGLPPKAPEKKKMNLEDDQPNMISSPIQSPVENNSLFSKTDSDFQEPYLVKKEVSKEDTMEEKKAPESFQKEIVQPIQEPIIKHDLESVADVNDELNSENNTKDAPVQTEEKEIEAKKIVWNLEEDAPEDKEPVNKNEADTFLGASSTPENKEPEVKRYFLEDDIEDTSVNEVNNNDSPTFQTSENKEETKRPSVESNLELARQRIEKIRQNSQKLKTLSGLSEMEREPAYKRRQIRLDDVPHSSESSVSRFSLGDIQDEEGNKRTGLSDNNSFLHDNVD